MSEESPTYHYSAVTEVDAVLSSPASSTWLKDALRAALVRDPVDAAADAEALAGLLARRCDSVLLQKKV